MSNEKDSNQDFEISNSRVSDSQIGGQAKRDLYANQIQGSNNNIFQVIQNYFRDSKSNTNIRSRNEVLLIQQVNSYKTIFSASLLGSGIGLSLGIIMFVIALILNRAGISTAGLTPSQFFLIAISVCPVGSIFLSLLINAFTIFKAEVQVKKRPNQGIIYSLINSIFTLVICFIFSFFVYKVAENYLSDFSYFKDNILIGLLVFIVSSTPLVMGGLTVIQHFSLRFLLYKRVFMPWFYADFLDYCTERLIIQRIGGRYRFIHKCIQDYYANMT